MRGLSESPCLKTRQQAPIATAPPTACFSGLAVFLAEVSDDLQPQRRQLKAHLQQFDIRVLPEDLYYFPDVTRLHQAIEHVGRGMQFRRTGAV